MKCNIDELVNNVKDKLGDVDFDNLLNGCLGNNSICLNNDFFNDDDLDIFDNDEDGVCVNPMVNNTGNKCCGKESESCCTNKKIQEKQGCCSCGGNANGTVGCVQDVCGEVAKRIGNVKVHCKFGCICGEDLECALVILQKMDCCGEYKDVAQAYTNKKGIAEFSCVEIGSYRVIQVIDGRYFNPPCYLPCDTFEISLLNRCIEITVVNSLNPMAERMLKERQEARRMIKLIEKEKNRAGRKNNCCKKNRRNNCCCGGNEGYWIIILLFLACGCGGFGLGCF